MALFPNANVYFQGKSHTSLVVSEGNAPAEKYIPSASESVKFQYEFGPKGNQNVVIPKGKAVTIAGMEWDIETEHYVPALKIADGLTDHAIGVNHHNVYERIRDRFSGNQPTVITREYIEVPLFPSKTFANAIKFGAAWVDVGGTPNQVDYANAIVGKKIVVDEFGNFTIAANSGQGDYTGANILGTCYGVETDIPPAGYLQYFMEMNDTEFDKFIKDMSYAPSPGRTKDADWNDIGTYPLGTGYLKDRKDLIKDFKAGIPFLTDGYFRSRTDKTYTLDTDGVTVKVGGKVTVGEVDPNGTANSGDEFTGITCTDYVGAALYIKIPDKFANDALKTGMVAGPEFANGPNPSDIKVFVADNKAGDSNKVQISPANIHVDYTNNMIVVYITEALDKKNVIIEATVLENQIPGIPTGWDFKNALGGVRILLQR